MTTEKDAVPSRAAIWKIVGIYLFLLVLSITPFPPLTPMMDRFLTRCVYIGAVGAVLLIIGIFAEITIKALRRPGSRQ